MYIRQAAEGDLPRMMEIYAVARRFMAAHGNPNQLVGPHWLGFPWAAIKRRATA